MSSGVSSNSNTWKERRITLTYPARSQPSPGDWRTFQLDGDKKRRQGSHVCPQLPDEQAWDLLLSSHLSLPTSSPSLLTSQTLQRISHLSFQVNYLRQKRRRNLKSFFSKHTAFRHSWLDTWTWVDIRLIASPQHTLRATAFGRSNMGRRLPWESLFSNLISNYSLSMIESKKNLYVHTFLEKVMRSV